MLLISLVAVATVVIAALLTACVWLISTIRQNTRLQAQGTAELLDAQASAHRRKLHQAWTVVDERDKTIEDLEMAVELLHLELQVKEEIGEPKADARGTNNQ